jgi:putative restriction endonuclease
MKERIFGHVPGYPEGSCFASRLELSEAGVHRPRVAGISGRGREGADSVVLAGGYEDTQDFGREILYTGHGGRDVETGKQIGHQVLTRGNLALVTNNLLGLPVRVVRGARHPSPYAPSLGYRYDGLYVVSDYWRERGRSGFRIWRFRLVKLTTVPPAESPGTKERK